MQFNYIQKVHLEGMEQVGSGDVHFSQVNDASTASTIIMD